MGLEPGKGQEDNHTQNDEILQEEKVLWWLLEGVGRKHHHLLWEKPLTAAELTENEK